MTDSNMVRLAVMVQPKQAAWVRKQRRRAQDSGQGDASLGSVVRALIVDAMAREGKRT